MNEWMDVANVHNTIYFNKANCAGPPQEAMASDLPPPCELAGLELNAKDCVLNCVEHLIKEGWAFTATIERAVP